MNSNHLFYSRRGGLLLRIVGRLEIWGSTLLGTALLVFSASAQVAAVNPNQHVLPTNAVVGGKSIGAWSAEWYKAFMPCPTNANPLRDRTGDYAHNCQPSGPVFFLAGVQFGDLHSSATRRFTIPVGKHIFFPVLNVYAGDPTDPISIDDRRDAAAGFATGYTELHASIDGVTLTDLPSRRAQSPVFSIPLASCDNMFTINNSRCIDGSMDNLVADGYYVMVAPLPLGEHVINFGNSHLFGFQIDITAHINVVPEPLAHVMSTNAVVGGKTIPDWSAEWWKWIFTGPTNQHPLLDLDGSAATNGQPVGDVFFLASVEWRSTTATRTFNVPEGKYLFFPPINAWGDNVFVDPPLPLGELRELNAGHIDIATNVYARIDGVAVPDVLARRAVAPAFSVFLSDPDNLESYVANAPFTGLNDPIVSDGYWIMLEPLSLGTHIIEYGGTFGPPLDFTISITNIITVVPASPIPPRPPPPTATNALDSNCPMAGPANPSRSPREDFWLPDGPVNAMVETNGVLYVGGQFDYVSPNSLTGGAYDQISAAPVPDFPKVNGAIKAIEPDRAGGWFVGGLFSSVGGHPLTNLARIRADRTVDTGWSPNPNGTVLTLLAASNKLYVGGTFNTIGGQTRWMLAALATEKGTVLPFRADATNSFVKPSVNALALSGNTLYLGGYFSFISGTEREHLGAVDAETGAVTAWYPNGFTGSQSGTRIDAMAISRNTLFVGGTFTSIGGAQENGLLRNFIAALDVKGGDLVASVLPWNPIADGPVTSLAVFCDTLYVGGTFTQIAGQTRNRLAALNVFTGEATDWNPNANHDVLSLRISGNSIFAGGKFTEIGGAPREFLAALDLESGRAELWNPKADFGVTGLGVAGGTVYGGGFVGGGGKHRKNVAAFDVRTGRPLDWAPEVTGGTLINASQYRGIYALVATANTLYLGGAFSHINGQPRSHAGAIDLRSGQATLWTPSPNGVVETLAISDDTVLLGGRFSEVGGMGRTNLARVNAVTGVPLAWNPGADDKVKALAVCGNTVFAGGLFTVAGGRAHHRLAALDLESGLAFNWNPSMSDQVSTLALAGSEVFFGGQFSSIDGQVRHRGASWNLEAGSNTCWNPDVRTVIGGVERSATLNAMLVAGDVVFVGGTFNRVSGQSRNNLAASRTNCVGTPTMWNPDVDGPVLALAARGDTLFAAGKFQNVGGQFRPHLAVFPPEGAPRLTVQPHTEQIGIGARVALVGEAIGERPLAFQWQFNGADIPGATGPALTIASARVSDSGEYALIVTNRLGLVRSRTATVTVLDPVRIVAQPAERTISPGATVTLNVVATGSPAPVYQWRLNGVNIPGAIYATLTLSNAQPRDGGSYSVVVANLGGAISSDIATVRIDSPALLFANVLGSLIRNQRPAKGPVGANNNRWPRLHPGRASGVGSGDNRTATVESGEPAHAGKRGGHSLWLSWVAPENGVAVFNTRGSDFDTLLAIYTRTNVTNLAEVASDEDRGGFATSQAAFNAVAGTEYLIAIDGFAGATGNIVLSWNLDTITAEIPRIVIQPQSKTIFAGQPVVFVANAASATTAAYQWFFNCERLPGATNASLLIPSGQYENVGSYHVQVTNASRYAAESQNAFLEIGPQPDVLSQDKLEDLLAVTRALGAAAGAGGAAAFSAAGVPGGVLLPSLGTIDSQIINNVTATTSLGETNHCGVLGGGSKWLAVVPSANGIIQFDTIGSDIDTVLAVYTGTSLYDIREVICDNNGAPDRIRSLVRFNAVGGTDYLLAVDGVNGARGTISLNWKHGQLPRMTVGGTNINVRAGGGFELVISVFSYTPDLRYQWRLNGTNIADGTNAAFTVSKVQLAQAGVYSVVVDNFAGSVTGVVATVLVAPVAPIRISYALTNGHIQIVGPLAHAYVIEGSTNLVGWQPLRTNSAATNSPLFWTDPQPATLRSRFYRVRPWP